jgi:hypothetical protein
MRSPARTSALASMTDFKFFQYSPFDSWNNRGNRAPKGLTIPLSLGIPGSVCQRRPSFAWPVRHDGFSRHRIPRSRSLTNKETQ